MLPETLTFEWHAFAELVTAAVLVAVVFPKSQGLYRRFIQTPSAPPAYSAPDLAYADSAVLRPGEAPALRHGDESLESGGDWIPTMLRQFEELSLSDYESISSDATGTVSATSSSVSSPAALTGATGVPSVRFLSSEITSERRSSPPSSLAARQSPQPSSQKVHKLDMSQFEPITLPPPPDRLATTRASRSASAPPHEPLSPMTEDEVQAALTGASASSAPKTKTKAKAKGKLQTSASVSSRGFSTAPALSASQGGPTTRSRSAAPGQFASTPVQQTANTIDELPVDSYLRHATKRAAWFESQSEILIAHPPDFSSRSDVQLEDVFINKVKETYQLWIWENDNTGKAVWKRVWLGYARPSDGRKLTVTPTRKEPSWVSEQWTSKTAKKRAP